MVLPSEWPPYTCLGFCAEAPEAVAAPGPRGRGRAAAKGEVRSGRGRCCPHAAWRAEGTGQGAGAQRTAHVWGQGSLAACAEPIRGTW